jgi:autotransporter-associated beta strand protein
MSRHERIGKRCLTALVGLAVAGVAALRVSAATWVGAVGSFTNGVNWDTGQVPANGVDARVGNGGTARFDGDTASVGRVGLGAGAGTIGTFEMAAGVLSNTTFCAGMDAFSTGIVVHTGGSLIQRSTETWLDPSVGIGYASNTVGSYTLSGGALTVNNGTFHVGSRGNGALVQTGGAVTGFNWMVVARYPGSVGDYTLAGGTLNQAGSSAGLVVGEQGHGVFTVSGSGVADLVAGLALSGGTGGGGWQGTGIVNLCAGGTINTPIVKKNLGSNATFNFDGGTLRARGNGSTIANFMEGLTAANVGPGGARVDSGDNAITINQSLLDGGGAGGLVKTGAGSLTLGGANAYAGKTVVSNGLLSAATAAALPGWDQNGRIEVCGGAGLAVGVGGSGSWSETDIAALLGNAAFAQGAFFGFDTAAGDVTVGMDLSSPLGLLKMGVNTLKLTGNNSHAGGTRVMKGVLQADFGTGLPASTNVTLEGGTLSTESGTLTLALGTGAGEVNIAPDKPAGFSAYGAPLNVRAGEAAGPLSWGSSAFAPNPLLLNEVGADQPLTFAADLDLAGGARGIAVNAAAAGAGATVTGAVTDSAGGGGLTKTGAGSLTLAGTNVFSGILQVSAGTLALTSPSNAVGQVNISYGGSLEVDGGVVRQTSGNILAGDVGNGSLNVYGGELRGRGALTMGQNTGSSGTLILTNGTVDCRVLCVGYYGTGTVVQSGGTLCLSSLGSSGNWRIGWHTPGVGTYTLAGGTLDTGSGNQFQIGYSGRGALLQTGGTLNSRAWPVVGRYLGGVGSYTLSGGVFNQTSASHGLVIGEQGHGTFTVDGSGVAELVGGLHFGGGGGTEGTGIVNLAVGGAINTPIVKRNNTIPATFNFDGGVLRARGNGAALVNFMKGLAAANVKGGGAVIDSGNNTVTVAQDLLSGAEPDGGLTKLGIGTLVLTGTNTYGGTTTVSNGILRIGSAASAPVGGAVAVAGGTYDLGGTSATNSRVTLQSGAIINGTLTADAYEVSEGHLSATLAGAGGLTKRGDGTVSMSGANHYTGDTVIESGVFKVGKEPAHRWSFNGDLNDSAGGSHATAVGAVTPGAAQYTLAGGARGTSYLSLGTDLLSPTTPVTIEIWATQHSVQKWGRIFSFGSDTANFIFMAWTQSTTLGQDRVEVQQGGVSTKVDNSMQPYALDTEYHVSLVIAPGGGPDGKTLFQWYKMDAAGNTLRSGSMSADFSLSALVQTNMWLGHSEHPDNDANASYNEVRIWDMALSQAQLATNSVLGADVLPALADTGVLSPASHVEIAPGAVLDLGASGQTAAGLSGSGTVSNGALTVTGTIAPGGTNAIGTLTVAASATLTGTLLVDVAADGASDLLRAQGGLDLTGLTLQIQDTSRLKARQQYVIATCAPGGLAGRFASSNLDAGCWSVSYNNPGGEVRLVSNGLVILVR